MKVRKYHTQMIQGACARWLSDLAVFAKAVQYARAAQKDERKGFRYTAAMEWRHAAELFASDTLAAEGFWLQWERIMLLPRRLAAPLSVISVSSSTEAYRSSAGR